MRYLLNLNVVLTIMSTVMAVVLSVVVLIYLVYMDVEPSLRRDLPLLSLVTGAFAVVAAAGGLAVYGQLRARRWHWGAQAAFVVVAVVTVQVCLQAFG